MKELIYYTDSLYRNPEVESEHVLQDFAGEERAYLLSYLIGILAEKREDSYKDFLWNLAENAPRYVENPAYRDYIGRSRDYYFLQGGNVPDSVLNRTYVYAYAAQEKITFKELLDQYTGHPLYLDFWASWCGPCREDILASGEVVRYLEAQGVVVVYISMDKNRKAWEKASEELRITQNQYLLWESESAPLQRYFYIGSIPRAIFLNARHEVESIVAPRAHLSELQRLKTLVEK